MNGEFNGSSDFIDNVREIYCEVFVSTYFQNRNAHVCP